MARDEFQNPASRPAFPGWSLGGGASLGISRSLWAAETALALSRVGTVTDLAGSWRLTLAQEVLPASRWATQQGGSRSEGSPGKEQSAPWQYQPWPEPREDLSQREDSEPQIRQETPNSVYLD